jgi:carbon storage regulator
MLVIRRRAGQSVLIGEEVEVQVTEIGPSRVKLCISAPKEITVLRKEVKLTREENLAAARAMPEGALIEFAAKLRA